ncbi:hypothetical protein C8R45DRAFT_1222755 [Mycena sanguinolenta]|nr:hypothetical protein C8R45DRAFT_1222755 [Mycena sanguinolenta]
MPLAAANTIPDEILSEILSPALRVSNAAFSALCDDSPFSSRRSEPPSAYLLVSKAWMRVATPLLYAIVVLRSKAQAQALAAALTENPALGGWIKKLRVEGGYAMSTLKVLQSAKNLTDLYLTFDIAGSDNASGLCRGLPLKLLEALVSCFPDWEKLTVFEMPHGDEELDGYEPETAQFVAEGPAEAPNLKTLVVWDLELSLRHVPSYMRTVAKNSSLKHIQIRPAVSPQNARFARRKTLYAHMKEDSRLKKLLDLTLDKTAVFVTPDEVLDSPMEPSSTFAYPVQLAANPEQEDAIWSRILFFALESQVSDDKWPLARHPDSQFSRLSPLLVCKKFARLGTLHLYEHVVLKDVRRAKAFAAQLVKQPALGQHVRTLLLDHGGDTALFQKTLTHTPALVSLHGGAAFRSITWKAFCDLSESAGTALRSCKGIRVSKPRGAVSPEVFARFVRMEKFEWVSTTEFKTERRLTDTTAFGGLVHLIVVGAFDESFSEVLAHMELPALRTAAFSPTASGGVAFFKTHGAKLREVTASENQINDPEIAFWLSCPSMTVLVVPSDQKHPVSASCLTTPDGHGRLERIVFRVHGDYRLKQADQTQLGKLMTVLHSTLSFPALREIEHPLCAWPTKERETKSNPWVKWAESLLERDVHLFGPDRVHWRQRLKYVPKGKQ